MSVVAEQSTEFVSRPRFEGSNICTWIGFKHVMYLIEEAVLDHLRCSGYAPRELYERYALAVEIVDSDVRIRHALHMDDVVRTRTVRAAAGSPGEMVLRTTSFVDGRPEVKVVTATVRVTFRRPATPAVEGAGPSELAP